MRYLEGSEHALLCPVPRSPTPDLALIPVPPPLSEVLTQDIPHIFAMTLFEEFIYWTDWETKSINRAHTTQGTNKTMLISTLHRPMDVHIYHPYRQPQGPPPSL